jgi:hypothetical protein
MRLLRPSDLRRLDCLGGLGRIVAIVCAACLQALPPSVSAQTPTHIYAPGWGLTLQTDGTGFYNDLARLLFDRAVGDSRYEILPYRRTVRAFLNNRESCLFPISYDFLIGGGQMTSRVGFIESAPVVRSPVHLFAAPGAPAPRGKAAVTGKSVAYAAGSAVPAFFDGFEAHFAAVDDEVDKARMLLAGRVDLLAAALPDAEFVFRSLGAELPPYDPAFAIERSALYLACHDTAANRAFTARLNARLASLRQAGALATFLRSQGLDPVTYLPDSP